MDGNGALVTEQFGQLAMFHGTPVGLDLQDFEFKDLAHFKECLERIPQLHAFTQFTVGDIFAKAKAQFGEKKAMSDTLCAITRYNPLAVRKFEEICEAIPRGYRRLGLSFEHHAAVSKVKSPGCADNHPRVVGGYEGCEECKQARLDTIKNWLEAADTKGWTAKELRNQVAGKTTVREHQRKLAGGEFDVDTFKSTVASAQASLEAVRKSLTPKLITKQDQLDRGKCRTLLKQIEELHEELKALESAIDKELD
jgi:hypothetical protein